MTKKKFLNFALHVFWKFVPFCRFNVDCSETEEFYSINEKIGSQEPIADNDVASDSKPQSQTSQRRQQQQPRQEPKPQSKFF